MATCPPQVHPPQVHPPLAVLKRQRGAKRGAVSGPLVATVNAAICHAAIKEVRRLKKKKKRVDSQVSLKLQDNSSCVTRTSLFTL